MRPGLALLLFLLTLAQVTPSPAKNWWCPSARAYYPQVRICPTGTWVQVGPTTAALPRPTSEGGAQARVNQLCAARQGDPFWRTTCSNAELRTLSVERIKAFRDARARLSPADRPTLDRSQQQWALTLAHGCGIAPDVVPTIPLAPEMRDCLARGSRGRIAYLRDYAQRPTAQTETPSALVPSVQRPTAQTETPPAVAPSAQRPTAQN